VAVLRLETVIVAARAQFGTKPAASAGHMPYSAKKDDAGATEIPDAPAIPDKPLQVLPNAARPGGTIVVGRRLAALRLTVLNWHGLLGG
jgi:hypothetical protein